MANGGSSVFSGPFFLLMVILALFLLAILLMGERLIGIEAKNIKGTENHNLSILPNMKDIKGAGKSDVSARGEQTVRLKKGMNINLEGKPSDQITEVQCSRYAIKPTDFLGISPIPKLFKNVGDNVLAGEPLFFDKKNPNIKYVAPVSGELIELNRGEKRRVEELVILADKEIQHFDHGIPESLDREKIIEFLLNTGAWTLIKQRPYGITPDFEVVPSNIFVSTFDTAPFAPNSALVVQGNEAAIQKALEILGTLTTGKVYLGMNGKQPELSSYFDSDSAKKVWFKGPHPAGNVGVQIHHISPLRKDETVWTLGLQELISLGRLFTDGIFDSSRIISVGGSMLNNPRHIKTHIGASVSDVMKHFDGLTGNERFVSGDVLSGDKVSDSGYLGFFHDQITVLEEGDYYEAFGWLVPQKLRPSASRTFPNFLFKDINYKADTNTHGENRAFVVTGQYEKVLPMDIYPQQLFKSILTNDFEKMEGLGIRELVEEDVALCEFVCTSKMPLQKILRQGLEEVREQG